MDCYETQMGWWFTYAHHPEYMGFFIEDIFPYVAYPQRIKDIKLLRKVEYDKLPKRAKTAIAATQSVIVENTQQNLSKIQNGE